VKQIREIIITREKKAKKETKRKCGREREVKLSWSYWKGVRGEEGRE
jgi:hypothetical protein